ncbi:ABC transporter permease [Ferrovibrio terrae]|nr:ABC transporter permease [Ferrovibrio terrae]
MFSYSRTILHSRRVILALARQALLSRFAGTGAGMLWTVFQPLAMVAAYWLVFTYGFRVTAPDGQPFAVYFVTGLLPWTFLSEALAAATGTVTRNSFLVRKIQFPSEVLPLVEILGASFPHVIFFVLTLLVLLGHGILPGIWIWQLLYAYFALAAFALGLGLALSAFNVFHRDVAQSITPVLNVWFWLTPIVWSLDMLPPTWRSLAALNPMTHIVEAYRAALLYGHPVWQPTLHVIAFWLITLTLLFCGYRSFMRLKSEFADVV